MPEVSVIWLKVVKKWADLRKMAADKENQEDLLDWVKAVPTKLGEAANKVPEPVKAPETYQKITYFLFGLGGVASFGFIYFGSMPLFGPLVDNLTGNHSTSHLSLAFYSFLIASFSLGWAIYRWGRVEGRTFRQSVGDALAVVMDVEWIPEVSTGLILVLLVLAFVLN